MHKTCHELNGLMHLEGRLFSLISLFAICMCLPVFTLLQVQCFEGVFFLVIIKKTKMEGRP